MLIRNAVRCICLIGLAGALSFASAVTISDQPVGFASLNGGTTGGTGGTVVVVSTIADFQTYASSTSPYIIYVSGTMGTDVTGTTDASGGNMSVITVKGDKTIFGLPGSKLIGRILIKGVSNVIVRNMTIQGPGAVDVDGQDAMTIQNSTNVWIDHCDIYDGQDGNLDIVNTSNNITVSWTKFHYTSNSVAAGAKGAHRFSSLICGTTDAANADYYQVTMQYNWWADGVTERMPRVRYGKIDVVNNLVTSAGNNYAVRAGLNASILVEANAFIGTKDPVDIYSGETGQTVTVKDNLLSGTSGTAAGTSTASFARATYYTNLTILPAAQVQAAVQGTLGAGATLCDVRASNCLTGVSSSSVSSSSVVVSSSVSTSSSSVSSSSSSATAAPVFTKHGTGGSTQTVTQGSSIIDFYFSWTNAITVTIQGVPTGVVTTIDPVAFTITFTGTVTADPGAYTYVITSVGGSSDVTKSGIITVVAATSSSSAVTSTGSSSSTATSSSATTVIRNRPLAIQSGSSQHQYDLLGRLTHTIFNP